MGYSAPTPEHLYVCEVLLCSRDANTLQSWPVCHISDNSGLYISILRSVVAGKEIGSGKNGYYLASPGSVAWNDLYSAMAQALAKRKVIQDATVKQATDEDLTKMASGLGCAKDFVLVQLGGQ